MAKFSYSGTGEGGVNIFDRSFMIELETERGELQEGEDNALGDI